MSPNTKAFFLTLSTAVSIFCVAAWASPGPNPSPSADSTPIPIPTAISYNCRFEGGSSGKSGGWFQHCHAEGEFPNPVPTLRPLGSNSTIKVICDDGNDAGNTTYNDGAKTRLDPSNESLTIRGLHSVTAFPPIVTVSSIDADDFCPLPAHYETRRFSSQIEFVENGNDYIVPGSCKFTCEIPVLK